VTLNNSIIDNSAANGDVAGPVAANSTLILTPTSALNPMLETLGYYGGPTETLPLLPGSSAIDAGNTSLLPADLIIDQRGAPRINASGKLDQGAFQSGPVQILVTTLADLDNGSINLFNATGVSLREAINFANADPSGGDTILFSPALSGTLTLTDGALPTITAAMTIQGPGADMLTIDANGQSQILALSASANLTMSGLTLANGSAPSQVGGAIGNFGGTLNLVACTISGSKADSGGGIFNSGTLTLTDSTLSANQATYYGGAVYNQLGTLTLTDCTVAGNTAQSAAGLDLVEGTNTLVACTISGNTATGAGHLYGRYVGGMSISGAGTTINDSIVAGNTGLPSDASDIGGPGLANGSNNLIGTGSVTGSNFALGSTALNLGPLAWNGGPTQTMAVLPGSPAMHLLLVAAPVSADQRGAPLDTPQPDIGAFQFQGLPPTVTVSGPTTGTVAIAGSFTFTATDPTPADQNGVFTYIVDWNGDRSDVETYTGEPATFTVSHAYQATGTYNPNVTVVDQDFRNSAAMSFSVQVSAGSIQAVVTAIQSNQTVIAGTPTELSSAVNAVNQVPADTWTSSNVADILLDGGDASTGVVIDFTSPDATIDVSSTSDAEQRLLNVSLYSLWAQGDATVNQLEIGANIVAISLVGAAAGGASEGIGDVVDEAEFTTARSESEFFVNPLTVNRVTGNSATQFIPSVKDVALEGALKAASKEVNLVGGAGLGVGSGALGAGGGSVGSIELGGSPALTIEQGNVTWSNALMGTQTDAPTVLVTGGTLNLTDNIVTGNVNGSKPLIEVGGGTFILGSADGKQTNLLASSNGAAFIHVALDGEVIVEPGNGFGQIFNDGTAQVAGATSVQLVSSSPVAATGQTVTFTATVTANGAAATDGSVEFFDYTTGAFLGMMPVNNGSASVQATFNDLTSGDTIYATYLPTTGALAPSSGHATQQVANATTTTLTGPSSSPTYGQAVTFTATVTAPTGSVEFFDGSTDLGQGTALSASGNSATSTFTIANLTAGPHTIRAVFTPEGTFAPSSDALDLNVIQATPTLSINPVNITFGTALANGQLGGSASWNVGGNAVAVPGTFTYISASGPFLSAGAGQSEAVTFTPTDNTDYTTASTTVSVTVAQATPTLQVTDAGGTYNQLAFAATVRVAGVNGVAGPSLEDVTPSLTYYSGPMASATPLAGAPILPGTYTAKASFAGSLDYTSASATSTFTIRPVSNPAAFVQHIYFDLLDRQANSEELNTWVADLNNGSLTKFQVVARIEANPEFRTDELEQTYAKFLGRSANPTGLADWTRFLLQNHSLEQLQANVIASREFFARFGASDNKTWLTAVYADVLHRAPDSLGLATWLADLAHGFGSDADRGTDGRFDLGISGNPDLAFVRRAEVADLILRSPEAEKDLVEGLYRAFLRRPSEQGGLNTWFNALQHGQPNVSGGDITQAREKRFSDEQAIIGIAGSDEYFARAATGVDRSGGLFNSPFGIFAADGGLGPGPGSPF
jgi:hypothetical protein